MKRKIVVCDRKAIMVLFDILKIDKVCKFCDTKVTIENLGGLYNMPIIVVCDNDCCLIKAKLEMDDE